MSFDPTGLDPGLALTFLFIGALAASTLIPLQSEALLLAALLVEGVSPAAAVVVATIGNTLGGQINWLIGRYARRFENARWFPVGAERLAQAERWYARRGVWSLLLCWTPWLGDPLTIAAGAMRTNFWIFTAITAPARLARYIVVVWVFNAV